MIPRAPSYTYLTKVPSDAILYFTTLRRGSRPAWTATASTATSTPASAPPRSRCSTSAAGRRRPLAAIQAVQPGAQVAIIETGTAIDVAAWYNALVAFALANGLFGVQMWWCTTNPCSGGSQVWSNSFAAEINAVSAALAAPARAASGPTSRSRVYQRKDPAVTITRGRPNQSSSANPATATCEIDNRTGDLTAENPAGQWYGQIGRNTPVRFSRARQRHLPADRGRQLVLREHAELSGAQHHRQHRHPD